MSVDLDTGGVGVQEKVSLHYATGATEANGNAYYTYNCDVTRNAAGRYTVKFNQPHPQGTRYALCLTVQDDNPNRDQRKIGYLNKTADGFDVVTTVDDNGGAADSYADIPFDWIVAYIDVVVTEVQEA